MKYLPVTLVVVLLLAVCSCSETDGVTGTPIGPEGGTVTGPDNVLLQIPEGALDREVEIVVTKVSGSPTGFHPAGDIYEFGPAGTAFAEPVEITLPYDESKVQGPETGVRVWWSLSMSGTWAPLEGAADASQNTVTGLATHFSLGAPGEPEGGCEPDCADRECGPDGCGDSCPPGCGTDETCNQTTGTCECAHESCGDACCAQGQICHQGSCCTPDCTGRDCGPDPACETSCGTCGENQTCSAAGLCECTHLACGADCCAADEVCHSGSCCLSSCDGKLCGDDGCGGSCGSCGASQQCNPDGICVDCLTEADCVFAEFCNDGLCESAYSAQAPFCDPCNNLDLLSCSDRANKCMMYPYMDDPFSQVSDQYCAPDCYDTGLCPNGFECSAIIVVGLTDLCSTDADCPGGLPCLKGAGEEMGLCPCHDTGNPCPANTCSTGLACAGGTCSGLGVILPCAQDSDCNLCYVTMHHCMTDADCRPVLCEPHEDQEYGFCVNTRLCGLTQGSHCPAP